MQWKSSLGLLANLLNY